MSDFLRHHNFDSTSGKISSAALRHKLTRDLPLKHGGQEMIDAMVGANDKLLQQGHLDTSDEVIMFCRVMTYMLKVELPTELALSEIEQTYGRVLLEDLANNLNGGIPLIAVDGIISDLADKETARRTRIATWLEDELLIKGPGSSAELAPRLEETLLNKLAK